MAMTAKMIREGILPSSSPSAAAGRVELFFKSPSELKDRIRFLRSFGISSFNLVNKDKKDKMDTWVNSIREVYPDADICAHYSLKHNKVPRKGIESHKELLLESLKHSNADEILLISGSGDKKAWNAVEALNAVSKANNRSQTATVDTTLHPKMTVAYNPYFPSQRDQEDENTRLKEKLATGCVSKIYLQFGTDTDCLRKGLEFIKKNSIKSDIAVAGSLFLPTQKLIAQQKFRPWNGVFLSSNFLSGPEEATAIVTEIIRVYKANDVEMLWEAPGIRTEKDMETLLKLLDATGDIEMSEIHDENNLVNAKGENHKRIPARDKGVSATKRQRKRIAERSEQKA